MRTLLGGLLMVSLVGCHCGPRCCVREPNCTKASCANNPPAESTAKPTTDDSQLPPAPTPNEPQAARSKKTQSAPVKPSIWSSATSSSAKSTAAKSASAQDESVKQVLADLEKTKREKATLQAKLSEDSARQTQQRLELEARLAVMQEQLRQQSALQQVMYQQQTTAMSRSQPNYAGQHYAGQHYAGQYVGVPVISPNTSSSNVANAWSNNGMSSSGYSGSNASAWNQPARSAQQVEQWPYSPQR